VAVAVGSVQLDTPKSLEDLHRGVVVDGDSNISPLQLPPWLDMGRCLRVHRFFEEHSMSLGIFWHCALVIGFSLPSLLEALVYTHATDTPATSLKRYMRTAQHLAAWHTGNIFDPASAAFASIQTVRQTHKGVRGSMQEKMPSQQHCWLSAYDMACVQLGFVGPIILFGRKVGVKNAEQVLDDYVYFWRCVGYQLGMADEFNPCSLGNPTTRNIAQELIDQVLMPDIAHPPADYTRIAAAYIDGLNLMFLGIPVMSVASTLAFTYWGLGHRVPWSGLSLADKCRYLFLRLVALMLVLLPPYRRSLGRALRATLQSCETCVEREATATCSPLAVSMLAPLLLLLVAVLAVVVILVGAIGLALLAPRSHQWPISWEHFAHQSLLNTSADLAQLVA
jgi:hypothetical protein